MPSCGATEPRHRSQGGTRKSSLRFVPGAEASEDTQAFWRRKTGSPVTPDEAKEIDRNITRLFDLLAAWDGLVGEAEDDAQ